MLEIYILYSLQLMMQERETNLSKMSFSSDLQVFAELDQLAESSGARSFDRKIIIQFLRSKGWVIEEMANIEDTQLDVESMANVVTEEPEESVTEPVAD